MLKHKEEINGLLTMSGSLSLCRAFITGSKAFGGEVMEHQGLGVAH